MPKVISPRVIPQVPRKIEAATKCNFSSVVTLIYEDLEPSYVIWAEGTYCSGANGIFPRWFRRSSICEGPLSCALLNAGELLYPPDNVNWTFIKTHPLWHILELKFAQLPIDSKFDSVRDYVTEQKAKWTLSDIT